ncbi:hypothetical protein [Kitasatospora purpeofusca]
MTTGSDAGGAVQLVQRKEAKAPFDAVLALHAPEQGALWQTPDR